ncbi:MAG TPA: hypothetical protein VI636_04810 [Candidatus Angelobacter sp.]
MAAEDKTPDDSKIQFVLNLNSAKLNALEAALENNWLAHLILAGAGVALVFNIADLPQLLTHYFLQQDAKDQKPAAALFLALLLYFFMKLGHLLTSFIAARQLQDSALQQYLGQNAAGNQQNCASRSNTATIVPALEKTTNFFVEAFHLAKDEQPGAWVYLLVASAVVSIAQSAALYVFARSYQLNRWFLCSAFLAGCLAVLFYCLLFRKGKETRAACIVLGAFSVFVLAALGLTTHRIASGVLLFSIAVIVVLHILFWSPQQGEGSASVQGRTASEMVFLAMFFPLILLAVYAVKAPY